MPACRTRLIVSPERQVGSISEHWKYLCQGKADRVSINRLAPAYVGGFLMITLYASEASIASGSSRGIHVVRVWSSLGVAPEESVLYFP